MTEERLFATDPTPHERGVRRRSNQRAQLDLFAPAAPTMSPPPKRCPACGGGPELERQCSCSTTGAEALELELAPTT